MRAISALLALTLLLNGCVAGWRTQSVSPAQTIRDRGPTEVQVKRNDGRYIYLRDPAVTADSIIGWEVPEWNENSPPARRAIALNEVRQVAVRGRDSAISAFVGVMIGLTTWVLLLAAACGGNCLE
jgi:hypothetical protein